MQRPVMNLKSTLERLAWTGSGHLPPAYEREDAAAWDRVWRENSRALAELLDVELLRIEEARDAGWGDLAGHEPRALAVRLPDGRVGVVDQRMATPKALVAPVHERVADYLLGRVESRVAHAAPRLPSMAREVLAADGLDPEACERLGFQLSRIALTIHGRHHGATRDLTPDYQIKYMEDLSNRRYLNIDPAGCFWSQIKIIVSKDPQVHVLDGKVTARVQLPEAIKNSLVGRPLTDVFEHPAFTGRTITAATSRPSGMTLKVS